MPGAEAGGMRRGRTAPLELAAAAQLACVLEVSAPKPGNVSRERDFEDATFEDFVLSAAAVAPVLGRAGEAGVGELVLEGVRATRRCVRSNTNLGIVLLLAPLARAAALHEGPLRRAVARVLSELSMADAEAAYAAIRLAGPGGLGKAQEQDVRDAPTVTLRDAMALAADRDTIAREYTTGFEITFGVGLPALRTARASGVDWSAAALQCYLAILAAVPDTLIARKRGRGAAESVSRSAAAALAAGAAGTRQRSEAVARLDAELRADGHSLNPGTTADLTAASLFACLLEDSIHPQEPKREGVV